MAAHAFTKSRHDVDRLDYFLSHKKHHSKLGLMPEQVAKNIHDSLEMLGHKGFFDVDDLDEISKDNLANCVAKCSTMIVYMNDETIMSEWCMYEWEVANKLDIPIKVIIDMSSCVKREVVDVVKESKCAFLLQHQWLEYSDASRLAIVEELSRWVSDVGRKTTGTDRRGLMFDNDGALCVRDHGTAIQLFHPLFEKYMLFCGLVYNPSAWSGRVAAWTRLVRLNAFACFGICLWRSIYATGPAYTDWYCSLFLLIVHAYLLHGLWYVISLLSSDVMAHLLEHISSSSMASLTSRRVNFISKYAAILGIVAASATAIVMLVIYLPSCVSHDYMEGSAQAKAFSVLSSIFFVSVAPMVLAQEFALLTLLFTSMELLKDAYESPICAFSEVIASVGLTSFVRTGSPYVSPSDTQIRKFSELWSSAWALQMDLQSYINPVLISHFFFNLMGLMIPVAYLMYGEGFFHRHQHTQPWTLWAKPILWVAFSMAVYSATISIPAWSNCQVESVLDRARCLNMSPREKQLLLTNLQVDARWRVGPLRLSGLGALQLIAIPVLGSLACSIIVGHEVVS